MTAQSRVVSAWMARWLPGPPGAAALIAIGLASAVFWPALFQLIELWRDSDRPYSHGVLVGPVALLLVVQACRRDSTVSTGGSWLGLLMLAGIGLAWLVGFVANVLAVQQLLFPAILILAVAALAGWRMAGRVLFPLSFLYFAIPLWSYVVPALQAMTVGVVRFVLDLMGIPVYVEGNVVTIPEGVFEIADGCAGLHYFIVALTISSLYSYLNFSRRSLQFGFVAIAAGLAILTNWVRVGTLVLFGHYTDMQHYLITHEHYYYGWVLYAIVLIPTFLIARWLIDKDRAPAEPRIADDGGPAAARARRVPASAQAWAFGVLLVAFATSVWLSGASNAPQPFAMEPVAAADGWALAPADARIWQPSFGGADASVAATYARGAIEIDAFIAVYRTQSQGRELASGDNDLSGPRFAPYRVDRAAVDGIPGLPFVQELVVRGGDGRERLIWSWYAVGNRLMIGDLKAKLWQLVPGLVGRDSGAVVAVSTPCGIDCREARDALGRFLVDMGEDLVGAAAECQAGRAVCPVSGLDITR